MRTIKSLAPLAAIAFVFTFLVAFLHKEAFLHPSVNILAGNQVASLFIFEFWWFKSFLSLFTPMIFFPMGVVVLLQSPLLTAFAFVLQTGMSAFAAYTTLTLLAYIASGTAMVWLTFHLTGRWSAALVAGYLFMFNGYSLTQHVLGHLNQSMTMFIPLIFLGLIFGRTALFAIGLIATCLFSSYFVLEIAMIAVPVFLFFHRPLLSKRVFLIYGLTAVICLLFYSQLLVVGRSLIGGDEFSSLSLLSFLDFPAWHPAEWIQNIRRFTSGFVDRELINQVGFIANPQVALLAKPENLMGFFGLSTVALLAGGIFTGAFKGQRAWIWLCVIGLVLALGPRLQIAYSETPIPLPYILIEKMPYLGMFRAPSRMILLTWIGVSILAALSFRQLVQKIKNPILEWGIAVLLIAVYSWEMGVSGIGRFYTVIDSGIVYTRIEKAEGNGAVFELPVAISTEGDVSVSVQQHMLYMPLHRKPLVVARPSRHTREALSFCENTDFIYELTHPSALLQLNNNPSLASRRKALISQGRDILRRNNIRFVVFHRDDETFSTDVKSVYEAFLAEALGPASVEEGGRVLFDLESA